MEMPVVCKHKDCIVLHAGKCPLCELSFTHELKVRQLAEMVMAAKADADEWEDACQLLRDKQRGVENGDV